MHIPRAHERKTDHINNTIESLGGRIGKVKQDLEHSIAEESRKRSEMGTTIGEQPELATRRMDALESGGGAEAKDRDVRDDKGWRPQHVILGGWTTKPP